MLEAYWAYADFEQMAQLVEEMICHLAQTVAEQVWVEHKDSEGNVIRGQSILSGRGAASALSRPHSRNRSAMVRLYD